MTDAPDTLTRYERDAMEIVREVLATRPYYPPVCDYIADRIGDGLVLQDDLCLLKTVENVKSDLHPVGGYLLSTKKTIAVADRNGRRYRITVEEAGDVLESLERETER